MLNPNEAPEGYEAYEDPSSFCPGCVFSARTHDGGAICRRPNTPPWTSCMPSARRDRTNVKFRRRVVLPGFSRAVQSLIQN